MRVRGDRAWVHVVVHVVVQAVHEPVVEAIRRAPVVVRRRRFVEVGVERRAAKVGSLDVLELAIGLATLSVAPETKAHPGRGRRTRARVGGTSTRAWGELLVGRTRTRGPRFIPRILLRGVLLSGAGAMGTIISISMAVRGAMGMGMGRPARRAGRAGRSVKAGAAHVLEPTVGHPLALSKFPKVEASPVRSSVRVGRNSRFRTEVALTAEVTGTTEVAVVVAVVVVTVKGIR